MSAWYAPPEPGPNEVEKIDGIWNWIDQVPDAPRDAKDSCGPQNEDEVEDYDNLKLWQTGEWECLSDFADDPFADFPEETPAERHYRDALNEVP